MLFIGLDLGSTYTKAALFTECEIVEELSVKTPQPEAMHSIRYEIDADVYFKQVLNLLNQLWRYDVQGILISTQMHGCLLTDEQFHPLTPYISWRDGLGSKWLSEFKRKYGCDAVSPSGVPWKGNLAVCALLGRIAEGDQLPTSGYFNTLGGYIIGRLTGNHVCHMTNAAPTGMADVRAGTWNMDLIGKVRLDHLVFPKILTRIETCGRWREIPVYPDLGDQQVCAAGAGLKEDTTLHISIGTAGLIGILTNQWGNENYENRPWLQPGVFLRTVSGQPGGRHFTAFAMNLQQIVEKLAGVSISLEQIMDYLGHVDAQPAEGINEIWEMPGKNVDIFIMNFYGSFAQAYRKAANQMRIPIRELAFSGGCASKNPALRHCITAFFSLPATDEAHEVWHGMREIISMLDK